MTTPDPSAAEALRTMVVAHANVSDVALQPVGPRVGADRGEPQMATNVFFSGHGVEVGVWECTAGGWAIVDRPTTETMMLLRGAVTITPAQGEPVSLSKGDVFVLPKGWSGRWDIAETVRKFYVLVD